jgi:hypothetical protein
MKLYRLILVFIFGVFLYGDVMYEMLTTTEGMMGMGGESMMRIFIKGDCSRSEITSKSEMTDEVTMISIIRLDKELMWVLDTDKKEYSEIKFGEFEAAEGKGEEESAEPEITVKKTGRKKEILNKECEEVVVSMKVKGDRGNMAFTQTMWVTEDIANYDELKNFNKKMTDLGTTSSSSSTMGNKKAYQDLQRKVREIDGFPLELDLAMTMGAEEMTFTIKTHSTVTKFDNAPINQKVFEIPEGYVPSKQ